MNLASGIYRGVVRHRRRTPRVHNFTYRLYMLYLDLDELPKLFQGRWFWSCERRNLYSFRRRDYLGDPQRPLDEEVRGVVKEHLGTRPEGPIRMLTQLRSFGFIFNPVTFYYCFDRDEDLAAIVAEITNTPWGERHRYVLPADARRPVVASRFAKDFHISPFMDMEMDYDWRFSKPEEQLLVHMNNRRNGELLFDVQMQLRREPITSRSLRRTAWRHPAMTIKVFAGIYWQALRLKMKRIPFVAHPQYATGDST